MTASPCKQTLPGAGAARAAQIARLWQQFKTKNCQKSRDALIEGHQHLVSITVGRLFGPLPGNVERDDLVGAGVIGLIKAVNQFDLGRGIKFETYAITLIRGAILEMLRGDDWVPRLVRDQQKQWKQACQRLETQLGRLATEAEVAQEMGIAPAKLTKLLADIGRSALLSLDDLRMESDQERHIDLLPSLAPSTSESVFLRERQRALACAIDKLPEREQRVIRMYYHAEKTFKQMGEALGVSESRAYQLHDQATQRLRGMLGEDWRAEA